MPDHPFIISVTIMKQFFDRGTSCFTEEHAQFAPKPEMFTVAHQIAHTAQIVEWFIDGAFSEKGMSTDFVAHEQEVRKICSVKDARTWMDRACKHAIEKLEKTSMAEMMKPIAPGIMGGDPRVAIINGMTDHTAHHRGALAVYARLLNIVPPMPYM